MKAFTTILFLASFTTLHAQLDHRDKIVGTWICREVSFLEDKEFANDPNKKEMEEMTRKGFLDSKFSFKPDNLFNLQVPNEMPGMAKEIQMLNGKKWFFYPEKNQISVGTPKENLWHLILKQKDGSVYFRLYETPIVLKMEKL
jgi:hypothetical protein